MAPAGEAAPCAPGQLSCGLQRPIISDGIRVFRNRDMGLRATFPAGSRVCLSRSGDAPRGFYARYGATEPGCPERGDGPASSMGIGASFNTTFQRSLGEAAAGDCGPLSGRVTALLAGEALAIPEHRSLACQADRRDGRVEIVVYAMAGSWPDGSPGGSPGDAPRVIYWASLGTEPQRLGQDLDMFRAFLRTVRIGDPE